MKQPRRPDAPPRKPRRRWRWHVPPAIVHGPATLEGTEVLDEVSGEFGLVLWQTLRDVALWSSVAPGERAGLFAAGAGKRRAAALLAAAPEPGVATPLGMIGGILDDPAGTSSEPVMLACREVSQWADAKGLLATALAFAQAAALSCPGNAAAGLKVGQLARRRAEYARAETWFRRTIGLARQSRDWASYAEAFAALGNLYVQRGNLPAARQFHIRALRAGRRHSLRHIVAGVLHDLFGIAVVGEQHDEAEALSRAAFEAYDPESPRVPAFAHDVASFWMEQGRFAPALTVFQALLPQMEHSPEMHFSVLGNLARSAGGVGDHEAFADASDRLWKLFRSSDVRENAAQALLDLARGAASLGEWSEAETAASTALKIATERQEARVVMTAESVLDAVKHERAMETAAAGAKAATDDADTFADELVRTLEEHTAVV